MTAVVWGMALGQPGSWVVEWVVEWAQVLVQVSHVWGKVWAALLGLV